MELFHRGIERIRKLGLLLFSVSLGIIACEAAIRLTEPSYIYLFWKDSVPIGASNRKKAPLLRQAVTRLSLPNQNSTQRFLIDSRLIYHANFSTDGFGRRITPQKKGPKHQHLAIFGCSYAFGVGVEDNQTLPYYLGEQNPSYHVYNYAMPAGGMNNMLAVLKNLPLTEQISEKNGIALYLMYSNIHMERAIGHWRSLAYNWPNPVFRRDGEKGELVYRGNFRDLFPATVWLVSAAYEHSKLVQRLFHSYVPRFSDRDLELAAEMVFESKKNYLTQFPQSKFYVVSMEPNPKFEKLLQVKGIDTVRMPDIGKLDALKFPLDGHYTAEGNRRIATAISSLLAKMVAEGRFELPTSAL